MRRSVCCLRTLRASVGQFVFLFYHKAPGNPNLLSDRSRFQCADSLFFANLFLNDFNLDAFGV
jgi:hypothetical protein